VFACAALLGPGARSVGIDRVGKSIIVDLAKSALAYTTEENEMEEVDFSVKVYGLQTTDRLSFGAEKDDGKGLPLDDSRRHPFVFVLMITRLYPDDKREWLWGRRCRTTPR
jgi:hypothetical protein